MSGQWNDFDPVGLVFQGACLVNLARMRQSRPDHDLGFAVRFVKIYQVGPSSLGSKRGEQKVIKGETRLSGQWNDFDSVGLVLWVRFEQHPIF